MSFLVRTLTLGEIPKYSDISLAIRGILAVLVLWWHCGGYIIEPLTLESFFHVPGRVSVWIFFVISGYFTFYGFKTLKYEISTKGILRFYYNRVLRIYPLFLSVTIVSIITKYLQGKAVVLDLDFVLKEILMIQLTHNYSLLGGFWFLGVIVQFYLILPLLYFIQKNHNSILIGILLYIFFYSISYIMFRFLDFSIDNRTVFGNLVHFQAGIMLHHFIEWFKKIDEKSAVFFFYMLMFLALILLFFSTYLYHYRSFYFWYICGAFITDIVGILFLSTHIIRSTFKKDASVYIKYLSAFGIFSYGLFCWHGYLLVCFYDLYVNNFILTLFVSFVLSYVSYILIERPFLNLKWRREAT